MVITYSKSKDQPGKVANPARGQLNKEMNNSLSPFAPMNLVSRDGFGSPVPRQPAHLHTQVESGAHLLLDFSRFPRRRPYIYLNRHTPLVQPRFYWITQLRTDGVHCRESAGTGPVNPKVVQTGAALAGHHGPTNAPLFPTPTIDIKWICWNYLENYWHCASGLSAVNAIYTQLRDLITRD